MSALTVAASSGEEISVTRDENDQVVVTWLCGGTRTFTPEELADTVAHLDQLAGHGVWMTGHDTHGDQYVARVAKGRLYAEDHAGHLDDTGPYVSWRALKTALGMKPAKPPPADYAPADTRPTLTLPTRAPAPAAPKRRRWFAPWRKRDVVVPS